jgi:uncharacterized repeat protein (TIGR03803 family)
MRKLLVYGFATLLPFCLPAQKHMLYGTTYKGGTSNVGTIVSYDPISAKENIEYSFFAPNSGSLPIASLTQASNGLLYSITTSGGKYNYGTLYSYNIYTGTLMVLHNFDSIHGWPAGDGNGIMQAKNGLLYGGTIYGGTYNEGVLYSFNLSTDTLIVLHNFDTVTGGWPSNEKLVEDTVNGILYGTTGGGGLNYDGVLYSYTIATNQYTVLQTFNAAVGGNTPGNDIYLAKNGMLYVMILGNDSNINGQILRYDPKTGNDTVVFNFNDTLGSDPQGDGMMLASNGLLYGVVNGGGKGGFIFSFDLATNKYVPLFSLDSATGASPYCTLVQNPDDGLLYGMTQLGGTDFTGVIFSYDINTGQEKVLHSFNSTNGDGYFPYAGLTLVKDTLTSVNELDVESEKVKVWPNPANTELNVEVQLQTGASDGICLYNMMGEKVICEELTNKLTSFAIDKFAAGIYLYRITDNEGNLIKTDKVVITH